MIKQVKEKNYQRELKKIKRNKYAKENKNYLSRRSS